MISKIRTNAVMLTKALISMICSMYNVKEEELVSYRNYYEILDNLKEARKIYGIAGTIPFDIRDDFDIFYYGFPIRKEKVKNV